MSRIGKLPIHVPAGVTFTVKDSVVTVKGPKGELVQPINPDINVSIEDGTIQLSRPTDEKNVRATWLLVFLKVIRKSWNL